MVKKSEIRSTKYETMSKFKCSKFKTKMLLCVFVIELLVIFRQQADPPKAENLFRNSIFGFRIWVAGTARVSA